MFVMRFNTDTPALDGYAGIEKMGRILGEVQGKVLEGLEGDAIVEETTGEPLGEWSLTEGDL